MCPLKPPGARTAGSWMTTLLTKAARRAPKTGGRKEAGTADYLVGPCPCECQTRDSVVLRCPSETNYHRVASFHVLQCLHLPRQSIVLSTQSSNPRLQSAPCPCRPRPARRCRRRRHCASAGDRASPAVGGGRYPLTRQCKCPLPTQRIFARCRQQAPRATSADQVQLPSTVLCRSSRVHLRRRAEPRR
jgi:hypothetical protein|eukprot:SAG25_NODE_211_length_11820_cov_9.700793_7_plen_189_part_00